MFLKWVPVEFLAKRAAIGDPFAPHGVRIAERLVSALGGIAEPDIPKCSLMIR